MSNTLVSIIVPIYNVEKYLARCVDSILDQTYKNLEVVLVDDGSPDDSGKICDSYKAIDTRVRVIHKKNGGLSDARNAGLDIINGEVVGFVDSDDWIEKNMIEVLLKRMQTDKSDISIGRRYRTYDDGRKELEKYRTFPSEKCFDNKDGLKYLMSFSGYDMSVCDKLFRKDLWNDIRFPMGKTCEDSFTSYKVFSKASIISYENTGLYNYYYRENSISRSNIVNETVIEANLEQLEFISKNYPSIIIEATSSLVTAIISVYNEYIVRNIEWCDLEKYRRIALKNITISLKNNNISKLKKVQFILFSYFPKLYKKFFSKIKK